jgi:hypothetical protein
MTRSAWKRVLAVASLAVAAACQDPDVGQRCDLAWGEVESTPRPDPVQLFLSGGADYFQSGNTDCENLVCIVSPAPEGSRYAAGGYCSKPCVSNEDCFQDETGLECRQMLLDDVFIDQLSAELRERYVPLQSTSYCAVPR